MKGFRERTGSSTYSLRSSGDSSYKISDSICSETGPSDGSFSNTSSRTGFFGSAFSIFETYSESRSCGKKTFCTRSNGWTAALKRVMSGGSMRKIQERVLGLNKASASVSSNDIWLLGVCYNIAQDGSSGDPTHSDGFAAFTEDFSSRILMTYRKGFLAIGGSKYTSDVGWGCMLRSSQMLVAQALLFHQLGRSWRKSSYKPLDLNYIEILHLFGDSEDSAFSIHNLLLAGRIYDLAPGSWVGPYAMCRTWEALARCKREENKLADKSLPVDIYVVSGDEDGERGGAPVLCIEDISRHCHLFAGGQVEWAPILLLVPLVLGLDKINPRYIPLLGKTFTFPQSLGILGGKPGASTYLVGVQDENAFYLDPHDVQQVVDIRRDNLEADTSSYHSNVVRHIPLDSIDPSLAIGFYCQGKDDFDDFCLRSSKLAEESNGAPLFTVTQTRNLAKTVNHCDTFNDSYELQNEMVAEEEDEEKGGCTQEDDWQLL